MRRTALALAVAALAPGCMPPSWGANALLHPPRRAVTAAPPLPHRDVEVRSDGATLRGWVFPARTPALWKAWDEVEAWIVARGGAPGGT